VEQALNSPGPDAFVMPDAVADQPGRRSRMDRLRTGKHGAGAAGVQVEIFRGQFSAAFDRHWDDLLFRADVPNVFMHPGVLNAAAPARRLTALLAWEQVPSGKRLVGLWAFATGKPHLSVFPIRALCAPATEHAYLSAPVIDRDCLVPALHAMLDAIAEARDLPKFVALESMSGEGPTYEALIRVLQERQSRFCQLDAKKRPMLVPGAEPEGYLEKALSGSSRKKLRQHRRRLGEKGRLETIVIRTAEDVRDNFEIFLKLETDGWKGRRGTAILCCPDDAAFARGLIATLAQTGDASIHVLQLEGRPVSMQVVLRAGSAAYTWKTAYDETLSIFSPGMLLFEDYSRAFLADPEIAFTDSCAYDDSSYMAAWRERKLVIDLWFDARGGASAKFSTLARLQKAYLPLRETAKRAYLGIAEIQPRMRAVSASWASMLKRTGKPAPANGSMARACKT
jgi:CelD/BcsL family acetyltransferase involved in cellulose biosynthesis